MVRTPGFHPGNGGSIPPGDTKKHCQRLSSWTKECLPVSRTGRHFLLFTFPPYGSTMVTFSPFVNANTSG